VENLEAATREELIAIIAAQQAQIDALLVRVAALEEENRRLRLPNIPGSQQRKVSLSSSPSINRHLANTGGLFGRVSRGQVTCRPTDKDNTSLSEWEVDRP